MSTHCNDDNLDCESPLEEFGETIMNFENQTCIDFLYTSADD